MNKDLQKVVLNCGLVLAGLVFGLALSEVAARVLLDAPAGYLLYSRERTSAHHTLETMVQDSRLLIRVPANSPGHDERGFRNPASLSRADVVAIGDSQTWGINARQSETWPATLGALENRPVYSMALGGWGPLQYELLAKDALDLNPTAILVGLYFGNDIFDSCSHTYGTDLYPKYRRTDTDYSSSLAELRDRLNRADNAARLDSVRQRLEEMGGPAKLWQGVARRSLLMQLLMTRGLIPSIPSVDELYEAADMAWGREHPEIAAVYATKEYSTVLTFGYRGVAVALENPCIQEGVRITKEVFSAVKAIGDQAGVPIGMVFIPTKETVYVTADPALRAQMADGFAQMIKNEAMIKQDLLGHCQKIGLVCVDATNRLVEAAKQGVVLYKSDSDGHPLAAGYRQIAYAGREALSALGGLAKQSSPQP
jgi:hypothetical protein